MIWSHTAHRRVASSPYGGLIHPSPQGHIRHMIRSHTTHRLRGHIRHMIGCHTTHRIGRHIRHMSYRPSHRCIPYDQVPFRITGGGIISICSGPIPPIAGVASSPYSQAHTAHRIGAYLPCDRVPYRPSPLAASCIIEASIPPIASGAYLPCDRVPYHPSHLAG